MSLLFIFHSYGLGAAVISKDLERCERLTKVKTIAFLNAAFAYIDGAHILLNNPWESISHPCHALQPQKYIHYFLLISIFFL